MKLIESMQDKFAARIDYGDPVEKDGTVVVPAMWVAGGGGFGLCARPSGSWVVTSKGAEWVPAVDLRAIAVVGSVVFMSLLRYLAKRR